MIVTFCGHSDLFAREDLFDKVLSVIKKTAKDEKMIFYLGGYGKFDDIAYRCCKAYQKEHPEALLIFVSPYQNEEYFKNRVYLLQNYDEILFAPIENTPPKYAISKRNEWMVKNADFLIAYVDYGWGGAAKTLKYAVNHKIPFVNLGSKTF